MSKVIKKDSRYFQMATSAANIRSVVMGWSCLGLGAWGRCSNRVVREASWRR